MRYVSSLYDEPFSSYCFVTILVFLGHFWLIISPFLPGEKFLPKSFLKCRYLWNENQGELFCTSKCTQNLWQLVLKEHLSFDSCENSVSLYYFKFSYNYTRDYKNADAGSIRKCLFEINWGRNIFHKNPNNQVEFLTDSILNTFSNICPNKTVIRRFKDKPWMTNEIKQKLKEKAKVYKSVLKTILIQVIRLLDEKIQQSSKLGMDTLVNFSEQGKKLLDPSFRCKKILVYIK